MAVEPTLRLFFAIECPLSVRQGIGRWHRSRSIAGIHVPEDNYHLTLAFLGDVPETQVPAVTAVASNVAQSGFFHPSTLWLDRVGRWANGVLHLSARRPPSTLLSFQAALQRALAEPSLGLRVDRRTWKPHLTLARDVPYLPSEQMRSPRFKWPVSSFVLMSSAPDSDGIVRYTCLRRWP